MMINVLRAALAAFVIAAASPALAASGRLSSSPTEPVEAIYELLKKPAADRPEVWFRPPYRDAFLSRSLAALFKQDDRYMEESGDQGNLDFDVAANSQDPDIVGLSLTRLGIKDGAETVRATFGRDAGRMTVDFRVLFERGAWRIDDIRPHQGGKVLSARALLSQPYVCGSTTRTPCKR
jgi:hypothetical protein